MSLAFDNIGAPLSFTHLELYLRSGLEYVHLPSYNKTLSWPTIDFLSRNFVFAQHRVVEDFDDDIAEELHTPGGHLWSEYQSNLTRLIDSEEGNSEPPLEECYLLVGRIANEESSAHNEWSHRSTNSGVDTRLLSATFSLCTHSGLVSCFYLFPCSLCHY